MLIDRETVRQSRAGRKTTRNSAGVVCNSWSKSSTYMYTCVLSGEDVHKCERGCRRPFCNLIEGETNSAAVYTIEVSTKCEYMWRPQHRGCEPVLALSSIHQGCCKG